MNQKILGIVLGVVAVVLTFILLPLQLTATTAITSANLTNLTGVSSVAPIVPLIILVMCLFGGGLLIFRSQRGGSTSMGQMLRVVWAQIVMFISLTLFPLIITQANTLYTASTSYTDFRSVMCITPLIVLIAIVFGGGWLTITGGAGRSVGGRRHGHRRVRRYA